MRILPDENLPRKLAAHVAGHQCRTVAESGWSGKTNGELLALVDPLFDVLLTFGKGLPYQQWLFSGRIAVLTVQGGSNRIQDLFPVIPECLAALARLQPRQAVRFGASPSR